MSFNGFGRLRPGASLQGKPKTIKPPFAPPGQGPTVGHGPFKCSYCGRYGQPGACEGCGAPNAPAPVARPASPDNRVIQAGILTPNEARARCGLPNIPMFDMVKR
jgi:hypothetical protein